jgi:N-dimethylarginine dimethylaminohydrolase
MTKQENKIPIKGYATFHPLKHCWLGSGFKTEWFHDLSIYKNNKIMDPLKRIADETEEDYQTLEKLLKDAGVQTYRSFLDINKVKSLKNIFRPPVAPRDHFAVIGEKIYVGRGNTLGYTDVLQKINKNSLSLYDEDNFVINTAAICRVGKDIWWDITKATPKDTINKYKKQWESEGFRVHISNRGYHSDSSFCVVKPGCIVSLKEIQKYETEFPNWDVLYLPDQSWAKVDSFLQMKDKVGGCWWLKGEEHNDELITFVNTWLNDWVGYVEETVFDVNMLSVDENTIICNNYNKEVFEHFKKHKVEPVVFNFRHRWFWDGGIHCITQDLYREGTQEDYFG